MQSIRNSQECHVPTSPQQVIMDADFKVLLVSLAVFLSTGVVFIYCFMGTFTTDQFLLYADISYESSWYKFPVKLQRYYVLILADSQRPRSFDGWGLIELTLVTFTKVLQIIRLIERNLSTYHTHISFSDYENGHELLLDVQEFRGITGRTVGRSAPLLQTALYGHRNGMLLTSSVVIPSQSTCRRSI